MRNNIDKRNKQTNAYLESQLKCYSNNLLQTVINKAEIINQSRIVNQPIQTYAPDNKSCAEYNNLAQELINRLLEK